ncbi:MAG: ATP synthase F1 subunit epsilon [Polyangiales bacterium]
MAQNELATVPRAGVLKLAVMTPKGAAVTAEADQVEAPSVDGEFGVLPGHRPLLAALRAGVVRYRSAGKTTSLAVDSGFAEVSAEGVTVLTDRCVNASDVDVAATRAELESAQRRFDAAQGSAETADLEEARRLVDWAAARLEAAKDAGKN